jgi:hypothetical protein
VGIVHPAVISAAAVTAAATTTMRPPTLGTATTLTILIVHNASRLFLEIAQSGVLRAYRPSDTVGLPMNRPSDVYHPAVCVI